MQDQGGLTGAPTLAVGDTVVDRYRIEKEIGRGGYAIVYRAVDVRTDEPVALKTIRPVAPRPEEVVARFRREVDLISRLRHRNTVRVFDYGFEEDLYLVMELLEGLPLSDVLDGINGLEPRRSVDIARGVLQSLTEAHGLGIVHRDLKPENVFLLNGVDGSEAVKVLDFGIAKVTGMSEQDLEQPDLTLQGRAMGTPTYMSPEQARGARLTTRSDIYAVSTLLYEMLCGVPPFQGESAMEIMLKHVNDPPPPLKQSAWRGSPLERALLKGLSKNPEQRFRSAHDYLNAIELPYEELFRGSAAAMAVVEDHKTLPLADSRPPSAMELASGPLPSTDEAEPPSVEIQPDASIARTEPTFESPESNATASPQESQHFATATDSDGPTQDTQVRTDTPTDTHDTVAGSTPVLQDAVTNNGKAPMPALLLAIVSAIVLLVAALAVLIWLS